MKNIRNFCIIAHIDHGKSTLADRMLEITHTIEKREMKNQVLDSMELERERGITIKMQPVKMLWKNCMLNLIDTPGHVDFSYEVSRAMKAVEGAILLVDSTQGVQAQTLSVLSMARETGLHIIPAVTKIDSPLARVDDIKKEIAAILDCSVESIVEVSGKAGTGVDTLLDRIVELVPPPEQKSNEPFRALVFDFKYLLHRGVVVFIRVMQGGVKQGEKLILKKGEYEFIAGEVGVFTPKEKPVENLSAGEIGYVVTGVKEAGIASVGDTIGKKGENVEMLAGYMSPAPVVWASIYPENQNDFPLLKQALERLRLTDSSLTFEEEASSILGKGFRAGFLGMLHLEIISERIKREFSLSVIITSPSIKYTVIYKNVYEGNLPAGRQEIFSPAFFPDDGMIESVQEPWIKIKIIIPSELLGDIVPILYTHEAEVQDTTSFGDGRSVVVADMPLRELMRNFFDKLKSTSKGFASLSYEFLGNREANVTRLDILVADEIVPAFSRVVSKRIVEDEAKKAVQKLSEVLPRQMIAIKIQGKAMGRIISSETLSAFRKDVTQHMYGGDITRKMKLREKQKKGKKKMQSRGKVNIPQDVFLKMIKPD